MPTIHKTALLTACVGLLGLAMCSSGVGVTDDYRDIKSPMFGTPRGAAYCAIGESMEDADPILKCWTPNDGFVASISHANGKAFFRYDKRFRSHYPAGYRTLAFGQSASYRCASVSAHFAEDCGYGIQIFSCVSRRTGLTCFNTTDKRGFWLGRYRGYRTIMM